MIRRLICWAKGHDLSDFGTVIVCRRCRQFWRKRDQVEVAG